MQTTLTASRQVFFAWLTFSWFSLFAVAAVPPLPLDRPTTAGLSCSGGVWNVTNSLTVDGIDALVGLSPAGAATGGTPSVISLQATGPDMLSFHFRLKEVTTTGYIHSKVAVGIDAETPSEIFGNVALGDSGWINHFVSVPAGSHTISLYFDSTLQPAGERVAFYLDRLLLHGDPWPWIVGESKLEVPQGQVVNAHYYLYAAATAVTVVGGSLPPGVTLNFSPTYSSYQFSLTGTPTTSGEWTATLRAANASGADEFTVRISSVPDVAAALDTPDRVWRRGGYYSFNSMAPLWRPTTADAAPGGDGVSASIGPVDANFFSSWLETDITGPVTVEYWSKGVVAGGPSWQSFQVLLDGVEQEGPVGYSWVQPHFDWKLKRTAIPAGNHTLRWELSNAPQTTLFLDRVQFRTDLPMITTPSISGHTELSATWGTVFSYQAVATQAVTWSTTWLPSGLTISPTGLISGIPQFSGRFTFQLTATNAAGQDTRSMAITVVGGLDVALDTVGLTWTQQQQHLAPLTFVGEPTGGAFDNDDCVTAAFLDTSWLEGNFTGPGLLSFWWLSDSRAAVLLDGTTAAVHRGEFKNRYGDYLAQPSAWEEAVITLPPGQHTVRWTKQRGTLKLDAVHFAADANPAPLLVTNRYHKLHVGQPFTLALAVESGAVAYTTIDSLPSGLSLDPAAGIISGIPQQPTTSRTTIKCTAADGSRSYAQLVFTVYPDLGITLDAPDLVFEEVSPHEFINWNSEPGYGADGIDSTSISGKGPLKLRCQLPAGLPGISFMWKRSGPSPMSVSVDGVVQASISNTQLWVQQEILFQNQLAHVIEWTVDNSVDYYGAGLDRILPYDGRPSINALPTVTLPIEMPFRWQLGVSGTPAPVVSTAFLPAGVTLDSATGLLTGEVASVMDWAATFVATSSSGTAQQMVHILFRPTIGQALEQPAWTWVASVPNSAVPKFESFEDKWDGIDFVRLSAGTLSTIITGPATVAFYYKNTCSVTQAPAGGGASSPSQTYQRTSGWTPATISVPEGEQRVTWSGACDLDQMRLVGGPTPFYTGPRQIYGQIGQAFSVQLITDPPDASITAVNLPAGFSLSTTGVLSGSKATSGVLPFTILVGPNRFSGKLDFTPPLPNAVGMPNGAFSDAGTDGAEAWFPTSQDSFDGASARSGRIPRGQKSTLRLSLSGPGVLKWRWKLIPNGADSLKFRINSDTLLSTTSETSYRLNTYTIPAGPQAISWRYERSELLPTAVFMGDGAAFLDSIDYTPTAYASWHAHHALDAAALPTADADQDGISNIMEYAMGMTPSRCDTISLTMAGMKFHPFQSDGTTPRNEWVLPTFTLAKNAAASDMNYIYERSHDLRNWITTGFILTDQGTSLSIRGTWPGNAQQGCFFRLRVEKK